MIVSALGLMAPFGQMSGQEYHVSGTVRDSSTGEPIPNAIVRLSGGARGTISNDDGVYRLILSAGEHTLVASCLGYGADTARVLLRAGTTRDFLLAPSEIILPEVLVTGEDPAYEIIRQAIANKRRWMSRLQSYQMDAFTRQVLRRDTTIASITEAFTKGYWREGDTLREISTQRRQTENIQEAMNFAAVGRLLNFSEDNIRFLGYNFAGPIADDAFDHYDYKLLRTKHAGAADLYEIAITPRSPTQPRFRGQVSIAGGSYALIGVDVEPNEAFLLPFVREKRLRYRQQFALFDQTYWLPADIRIDGEFTVGMPGISLPVIGFAQTSVITGYQINVPIPDSIFQRPRFLKDTTTVIADSARWQGQDVLPLTGAEQLAYETIDSTKTLEMQFRPRGFAMTLGGDSSAVGSVTDIVDISFNRVEGVHLGVKFSMENILDRLSVRGGLAYGFSDRITKYNAGATVHLDNQKQFSVGGEYYKVLDVIPEQGYYGKEFNSLTSILFKNDYRDYYLTEGWDASVSFAPGRMLRMTALVRVEDHTAAKRNTDFSVFGGSQYRENPQVSGGRYEALQFDISIGREPIPLDLLSSNSLDLRIETPLEESDWVQFSGVGTLHITTLSTRFLSPPGFRIRLAGGSTLGSAPRQRTFSLESASSGIGPFGVMKAMNVKEFHGEDYVALNVEHNFRSLPFLALSIPFLYENNIEFIVHGGVAKSWDGSDDGLSPVVHGGDPAEALQTTDGLYVEAGFGVSRIFELLRCDFTWRLSEPRFFRFTVGVANLL